MRTETAIAAIAVLLLLLGPVTGHASPESRMAGSKIHAAPRKENMQTKTVHSGGQAPAVVKVSYKDLESLGVLNKPQEGSLGRDLWNGTKRSTLTAYLPMIPGMSEYRTMQNLSRRLLLTGADAGLIEPDSEPEPGNDLTTLRIEKLLEMGAYKEALALYTGSKGEPYHERFARAGVLAALYNRESALACLETRAVENRFSDVAFWQHISKICSYILSKSGNKTPLGSVDLRFPESKILQSIVDKDSYRFIPVSFEDLKELEPLEAALLAADRRVDLANMDFLEGGKVPAHVLALLMEDPSLTGEQAFQLMVQAVEQGVRTPQDLADYYDSKAAELFGKDRKKTSLAGYKKIAGWQRLPYLYRAATNAAAGREQTAVMKQALALAQEYGNATLWPLSDIIGLVDPDDLDEEAIRKGFEILAETGEKISPAWAENWQAIQRKNSKADKNSGLLTLIAYAIGNKVQDSDDFQTLDLTGNLKNLGQQEQQLLEIVQEKLDKFEELHNYSASGTYEKKPDLTSAVDYVMPSVGLLDHLKKAESDQRLGEIILLSSIALRDTPANKLYAGTFQEVLDGLITVGLTEEAQSLSREVILGLSVNKRRK